MLMLNSVCHQHVIFNPINKTTLTRAEHTLSRHFQITYQFTQYLVPMLELFR